MFIVPTRFLKQEIKYYIILSMLLIAILTYTISGTTPVLTRWVIAFVFCAVQSMGILLFIIYRCSYVVTKDMKLSIYVEGNLIETTGKEIVKIIDDYIKQSSKTKNYIMFGKNVRGLRNKKEYNFALYFRYMKILNKFNNVKDYTDMLTYIMYKDKRKDIITSNTIMYNIYYPDLKRNKKW